MVHLRIREIKKLSMLLAVFSFFSFMTSDQGTFPSVELKSLNGKSVDSRDFSNNGKPVVIALWAVWCKHCHEELSIINDEHSDWLEQNEIKVIAISIDDSRNSRKVKPFVVSQGWDFEVYLDLNSDLKRALGVNSLPYIAVLDKNMEIVYQRHSYLEGDEEELIELLKKLD